jgi:hypothetical protein
MGKAAVKRRAKIFSRCEVTIEAALGGIFLERVQNGGKCDPG